MSIKIRNLLKYCLILLLLTNQLPVQSQIIFSRSNGGLNTGGTLDLMIYDLESDETKLLMKGSVRRRGEYGATTSPDNSRIVFSTYRFSGWKLAVADFKNNTVYNIEKLTGRSNYEYVAKFSPDGKKIAYQEYSWGRNKATIYLCDRDGKNNSKFFDSDISDQSLDWTIDNKAIVFVNASGPSLQICKKSLDGTIYQELTDHSSNSFAPSVSKTGDKIAFLSDAEGKIHLFTMNLDGTGRQNITPGLESMDADINSIWAYKTSWSPDGKQIVFNVSINGDLEIYVVNRDGTELTQITDNSDTDMTPYWMN